MYQQTSQRNSPKVQQKRSGRQRRVQLNRLKERQQAAARSDECFAIFALTLADATRFDARKKMAPSAVDSDTSRELDLCSLARRNALALS